MTPVLPLTDLLRLAAGPIVWFAHFTILYGTEAIICGSPASAAATMLQVGSAATIIALLLLGFILTVLRKRLGSALISRHKTSLFLLDVTSLLAFLAMLGILWTAFPIAVLSACKA